MSKEFTFHQAIFGYDAGHNLLASSLSLPVESKHFLSVATDLSGSAPLEGFEIAYTGMPCPGTDYYALFCTWLALEMPRPGCVWSHVLFIQLADFAELRDLSDLRRLFRRPNSLDLENHLNPISYWPESASQSKINSDTAIEVLAGLYISWERAIVASVIASSELEDLVFALWSQQWPRLRRNFRFSTGSFADRGRNGPAFDLQITPISNRRAWQREEKHFLLDNNLHNGLFEVNGRPVWMHSAVEDLFAPNTSGFRSFLFQFGADFESLRGSFAKLANVFTGVYVNADNNWEAKLTWVANVFPGPAEANGLKEHLLGLRQPLNSEKDLERVWETACFLLASKESNAFSKVSFDANFYASSLWKMKREKLLHLLGRLMRQPRNPIAAAFASAISGLVKPTELKLIADQYQELIPVFLTHQPSLALDVLTWQLSEATQWKITEVLNKLSLNQQFWGEIMAAKFIAATVVGVRESIENAGVFAIIGITKWLESSVADEFLPSQIWRDSLANPITHYLQKERSLPPESLALCAWTIAPNTIREVLDASRKDVQLLAQQPLTILPKPLRLPTAFLLVTLGLRSQGPEGVKLIRRGYFDVYEALASSTEFRHNFPWESWMLLSGELPQPGMFRDWDRCKRLRKAVIKWIRKRPEFGNALFVDDSKPEHRDIARKTLDSENEPEEFID